MITIITGVPGMGKTALVVQMMMKQLENGDRPFFVMGIPDLKLDHSPVPPVIEWTEKRPDKDDPTVLLDYYTFPPNSIIIIDEAQRVFRPRASTSKVPPHVAAYETHRHTGVDFWLLTQKPGLIDINIRELCGRHIHLKNTIMGRYLYEWPEYQDVNSKANLAMAVKRRFSPPAAAFRNYKSAEVHTKQPRRFHQAYLVLAFGLIAFFGMSYRFITNMKERVKPPETIAINAPETKTEQPDHVIQPTQPTDNNLTPVKSTSEAVHPYMGYQFIIKAKITSANFSKTYFEIRNGSNMVFTNTDELEKLGYSINQPNDCAAFLFFNGAQIVATCQADSSTGDARQGGTGAAVKAVLPAPTSEKHYPHAQEM